MNNHTSTSFPSPSNGGTVTAQDEAVHKNGTIIQYSEHGRPPPDRTRNALSPPTPPSPPYSRSRSVSRVSSTATSRGMSSSRVRSIIERHDPREPYFPLDASISLLEETVMLRARRSLSCRSSNNLLSVAFLMKFSGTGEVEYLHRATFSLKKVADEQQRNMNPNPAENSDGSDELAYTAISLMSEFSQRNEILFNAHASIPLNPGAFSRQFHPQQLQHIHALATELSNSVLSRGGNPFRSLAEAIILYENALSFSQTLRGVVPSTSHSRPL